MSLDILFHFLCAHHVSDINISIIRSLRLFCWITTEASACNTDTTPTQPHRNSNAHRTKNNMTNVVIQQNSLLNYHWSWSLQHGYHSNPTTPKLQHTSNQEQYDQCGNSTEYSHAPDDGYINVRNMLST